MLGRLACCSKRLSSPVLGRKQPAPYYKKHSGESPEAPFSQIKGGDLRTACVLANLSS